MDNGKLETVPGCFTWSHPSNEADPVTHEMQKLSICIQASPYLDLNVSSNNGPKSSGVMS